MKENPNMNPAEEVDSATGLTPSQLSEKLKGFVERDKQIEQGLYNNAFGPLLTGEALKQKVDGLDKRREDETEALTKAHQALGMPTDNLGSAEITAINAEKSSLAGVPLAEQPVGSEDRQIAVAKESLVRLKAEKPEEYAFQVKKSAEHLEDGRETSKQAVERLRREGRHFEAEVMADVGRNEIPKEIKDIAAELRAYLDKEATERGFKIDSTVDAGINAVLAGEPLSPAIQASLESSKVYYGKIGGMTGDIKQQIMQSAHVGNEIDAVAMLAFAKEQLQKGI